MIFHLITFRLNMSIWAMISSSVVLAILLGTFVQCVEHHNVQELLVPLHSITPLMCEVIFNQDTSKTATWYRNGEPIAKIQRYYTNISND